MKLTPLEIKKQQFEKTLRGYDVAEVKSFLTLVSNEVEQLQNKNKELEEEIQKLSKRVEHYEKVEEALHETLQTTKDSALIKIEQAKAEAQNLIKKAELEAEAIIQKANNSRHNVRHDILRLLDKREEIIAGIGSYLENTGHVLNQFKNDDMRTYVLNEPESTAAAPGPAAEQDSPVKFNPDFSEDENPAEKHDNAPTNDENIDDILDEID